MKTFVKTILETVGVISLGIAVTVGTAYIASRLGVAQSLFAMLTTADPLVLLYLFASGAACFGLSELLGE